MTEFKDDFNNQHIAAFDRQFFTGKEKFTYIGSGSLGGKAHGLARISDILQRNIENKYAPDIIVNIPTLAVIATDYFDRFMKQNSLYEVAFSDLRDDRVAHAFQKAELPVQLVGDLRALISQVHQPLAIRSSSMLEDAMFEPFASVYATKMIPNNQFDADTRFKKLVEAVKFIYASTYFKDAKNYIKMTKHTTADEKMAVIIQEVVGSRYGDRFYPHICGVGRSHNFYPTGNARPEDGVVDLALGLGKAIVDDSIAWSYAPSYPKADPPYNSIGELMKFSQTEFWAINMGKPPEYNPIKETEYMFKYNIQDAEQDGTLKYIASTYNRQDDRIITGIGLKGPRLLNFAPILRAGRLPLNELMTDLLKTCEDVIGTEIEIEFALTMDDQSCTPARFGFLQVRPMVVSNEEVEVAPQELYGDKILVAAEKVLGNGVIENIQDIVFVKREKFAASHTLTIANHLEQVNNELVDSKKRYLLIGFGRWGTSDPQGGIPVNFGQISGAKVIVESTLPEMDFMMSQGSHFFHNITSFKVCYFSVNHWGDFKIDWEWLNEQETVSETEFIKHVRLQAPLLIKVDGRSGRGVIRHR